MQSKQNNFKLYLAPLKGFTDYIFRNSYCRHFDGFDGAIAPFFPTMAGNQIKARHIKDVLPENNGHLPVIPQIMGNNSEDFIGLARHLHDLGYETINWNLGCPFPMVAKKMRGSGLLPHPEMIDAFLDKTLSEIPNRLSIKVRLGRYKVDEINTLMPILNRYPLDEIIIHPRTAKQMYTGEPDLDAFEKCLELCGHRVVYNGDINSRRAFIRLADRFKSIDRWMIGRWAIADPFLPGSIKSGVNGCHNKLEKFRDFYNDLFSEYQRILSGPGHLLGRMKGFWNYFSLSFKDGRKIVKKIHHAHKLDSYRRIVETFFEHDAEWTDLTSTTNFPKSN